MKKLFDELDEFDKAWSLYPRKLAKGDARKAWKQTASIRPPFQELINAILKAMETAQWRENGGRYIPYFATWLRAERWADEWPTTSASDAVDATEAFNLLRECIRANKEPPAAIKAAAQAIGGFYRLQEMTSFEIQARQKQFEQAYKSGAH